MKAFLHFLQKWESPEAVINAVENLALGGYQ